MASYCPHCGSTPCYIPFASQKVECSNVSCAFYSASLYPEPPPCFHDIDTETDEEKTDPGIGTGNDSSGDIPEEYTGADGDDITDNASTVIIPTRIKGLYGIKD